MWKFIKRHKILVPMVLLIIIAIPIFFVMRNRDKNNKHYEKVSRGSIVEAIYGIGTVTAENIFQLKLGIPSVIDAMYVHEGQHIRKGEKLIRVDGMHEFRAPINGIVTEVFFKKGETIFPQTNVLTITDFNDLYVLVSLEQRGAIRAAKGQKAVLSFETLRDQNFEGVVESVYSSRDRFFVRINIDKFPPSILPGMTADVSITLKKHDDMVLIPLTAINKGKVQMKRGDDEVREVDVQVGLSDAHKAQVVGGELKEGDLVVIPK